MVKTSIKNYNTIVRFLELVLSLKHKRKRKKLECCFMCILKHEKPDLSSLVERSMSHACSLTNNNRHRFRLTLHPDFHYQFCQLQEGQSMFYPSLFSFLEFAPL